MTTPTPTPTGQPARAASAAASPTAPPTDPSTTWRVGVTLFKGIDLSSENDYLRESLPLLILDGLSGIATHRYTASERAIYQRTIVADALQAAEVSLSDLRQKRSALFYESSAASSSSAPAAAPPAAASTTGAQAPTAAASTGTTSTAGTTTAAATTSATSATTSTATAAAGITSAGTTPTSPSTTAASQSSVSGPFVSIDASIADALKRIAFLKRFDSALIAIAETKPVVFVTGATATAPAGGAPSGTAAGGASSAPAAPGATATPSAAPAAAAAGATAPSAAGASPGAAAGTTGAGGSQLLAYPAVSPAEKAKASSLDFLVSGRITEAEGYLIIDVSAYNADLGAQSYSLRTVVGPSDAFGALRSATAALATEILGREWATLRLAVEPSGALVYVDGKFYGVGNAELRFLSTGRHEIMVRAPGHKEEQASVELEPLATKNLSFSLKKSAADEIAIVTYPQGADVYLNSLWEGKSPLLVDRPLDPVSLLVRRKDYLDYSGTLLPDSPPSATIRLLPDAFKKGEYTDDLRNRFYATFGAFAVSVILPVTAYSLWQSNGIMYQEALAGSLDEERLKNLTTTWYYTLWGGVFISVSLFVNTVIDVIHYLRASD